MNLLSVLSIIIYTLFFIGASHMLTIKRKRILNRASSAVLFSLGWWSFCNSFFFAASTQQEAWFWHKLSSIGWCGFVALAAYYFLAMINSDPKIMVWWKKILFFTPTIVLICKNLFGKTTSLAQNIVRPAIGTGWTYENSVTSPWLWIYLAYVAIYFGFSFYLLTKWAKAAKHKMKQDMAIWFIAVDTVTILCGVATDVVLPLTNPVLPALASIATAIFGMGYFAIIYRADLFNINLVISSDDILQTCNNSIFVIDESKEILKYNRAVESLLGVGKSELLGADFMSFAQEPIDFSPLYSGADMFGIEARLRCKGGEIKDVLLSASVANDKSNSFLCIIVSCQDISKQKRVQDELEVERERYKLLARDFRQLAYFDLLTGLPNRRSLLDTLGEFEKRYKSHQEDFAIIFLDLDNFKNANDQYGHLGGDQLLVATSKKIKSCVGEKEFVARLGGDEFMVIMPYDKEVSPLGKIQQIQDEFHRKISFSGEAYEIKISAGYAVFSQVGNTSKLMQTADEAMYVNKKA